jgi:alkanesulfonate monooxygenase SsuD/methylene tetrahydromethanopterin reductase-like flavin-dependent oxidoreductase (luciferase family)
MRLTDSPIQVGNSLYLPYPTEYSIELKFYLTGLGNLAENQSHIANSIIEADHLGLDGALMPDHYMWGSEIGHSMKNPFSTLETWTTLSYLAGKTEKISLGTLVTPLALRHPGMLAKMLSTLDNLSDGRVVLGVGAGWSQVEFRGYSSWLEPGERVGKTVEALKLILDLWSEDSVTHHGKHYEVDGAVLLPKPVQKPHPRLLFGSQGKRMLRLTGRYGDIVYVPPWIQEKIFDTVTTVKAAADEAGRKPPSLMLGIMDSRNYNATEYSRGIDAAEKAGAEYYTVAFPRDDPNALKKFSEDVMPSYK